MYEPTLVVTDHPSPQVKIDFDSVDPAAVRADVYANGVLLQDGGQVFAAGGFTLTDYQLSLGVPVVYAAELFNSSGASLGFTGSSTAMVYGAEGYAWFSSLYDPELAVLVPLSANFGGGKRATDQQSYRVGYDTVALLGTLGLLTDFNASCVTESLVQADVLKQILAQGVVLVRTTPRLRLPPLLYLVIPSFYESGNGSLDDVEFGGERIEWPLEQCFEVTRPGVSGGSSFATWEPYRAAFVTWADMKAAFSTWLDAQKNPPGV